MESIGRQEAVSLLEKPMTDDLDNPSFFKDAEEVSFEDFLDMVENKLATMEKNENETNEDYLNMVKGERKLFLEKIKDEKKKNAAEIMFDAQGYVNQLNFGLEKGELPIKLKGSELQKDVANFLFKNNNQEEVKELWRIYDKFFKLGGKKAIESGEGMKSAILSMVGLKKILTKNYIADVIFTEPNIDVFYSIDVIAMANVENDKERKSMLFQIKSLNGEKITDVIWENFDSEDLSWNTKFGEKENNFKKGCKKYFNSNADIFSKIDKSNISAIFARLPIKSEGKSSIDMMGEPHEELEKYIVSKIDDENPNLAKRNKR